MTAHRESDDTPSGGCCESADQVIEAPGRRPQAGYANNGHFTIALGRRALVNCKMYLLHAVCPDRDGVDGELSSGHRGEE
eukprot:scaffold171950_cov33-Tisochrysis_lutea.AAC.1